MQPTLRLIRGLPGSGKSTLATSLLNYSHFEADQYFIQPDGSYKFDATLLPAAHRQCLYATTEALTSGNNVAVSNTFTTFRELRPYIELAMCVNANVVITTLTTNYGSIHSVPASTIEAMTARMLPHEQVMALTRHRLYPNHTHLLNQSEHI